MRRTSEEVMVDIANHCTTEWRIKRIYLEAVISAIEAAGYEIVKKHTPIVDDIVNMSKGTVKS